MTNFGVIIPYRNDRPRFFDNLRRMLEAQTVKPAREVLIMDYPAESDAKDITQRYRRGYDMLRGLGLDVIFFMEVDDWYSPKYFEFMLASWEKNNRPEIFGTSYTFYYHIKLFAYYRMGHYERSSAMSTMILPDLNINWCPDHEPYTDSHLWTMAGLKGVTFTPSEHICLGIKHGVGKLGGGSHIDALHRYSSGTGILDGNKDFLRSTLDPVSFEFYSNYFNQQEHE